MSKYPEVVDKCNQFFSGIIKEENQNDPDIVKLKNKVIEGIEASETEQEANTVLLVTIEMFLNKVVSETIV